MNSIANRQGKSYRVHLEGSKEGIFNFLLKSQHNNSFVVVSTGEQEPKGPQSISASSSTTGWVLCSEQENNGMQPRTAGKHKGWCKFPTPAIPANTVTSLCRSMFQMDKEKTPLKQPTVSQGKQGVGVALGNEALETVGDVTEVLEATCGTAKN